MNSTDLIGDVQKRFAEYQLERDSFEKDIEWIIIFWMREKNFLLEKHGPDGAIDIDAYLSRRMKELLPIQLQYIKSWHYRSFYNGWIEGRINLLKDEK